MAEQAIENLRVTGSNPVPGTLKFLKWKKEIVEKSKDWKLRFQNKVFFNPSLVRIPFWKRFVYQRSWYIKSFQLNLNSLHISFKNLFDGWVVEWSMALVLKTNVARATKGSNPFPPLFFIQYPEKYLLTKDPIKNKKVHEICIFFISGRERIELSVRWKAYAELAIRSFKPLRQRPFLPYLPLHFKKSCKSEIFSILLFYERSKIRSN